MLAFQEPDIANKDDATFAEGCARAAYTELCSLKGDDHADTLSCLAGFTKRIRQELNAMAAELVCACCSVRAVQEEVSEDAIVGQLLPRLCLWREFLKRSPLRSSRVFARAQQ